MQFRSLIWPLVKMNCPPLVLDKVFLLLRVLLVQRHSTIDELSSKAMSLIVEPKIGKKCKSGAAFFQKDIIITAGLLKMYLCFKGKEGVIRGSGGSGLSHGTHRRQSEFDVIGLIYQALS